MSPQQLTLFGEPEAQAQAHGAGKPVVRPPETRDELDAIVNAIPEREIIACKWAPVANGYIGPFCAVGGHIEMMFWTRPECRKPKKDSPDA
jgi:hypothetical protein